MTAAQALWARIVGAERGAANSLSELERLVRRMRREAKRGGGIGADAVDATLRIRDAAEALVIDASRIEDLSAARADLAGQAKKGRR